MNKAVLGALILIVLAGVGWLVQNNINKGLTPVDYQSLQTLLKKERIQLQHTMANESKKEEERLTIEQSSLKKTIQELENGITEDQKDLKELEKKIGELKDAQKKHIFRNKQARRPQKNSSSDEVRRQKIKNRLNFLQRRRSEEVQKKADAEEDLRELEARYHDKRHGRYVYKNNKRKFIPYTRKLSYFDYKDYQSRYESAIRDAQASIDDIDRTMTTLQDELAELSIKQQTLSQPSAPDFRDQGNSGLTARLAELERRFEKDRKALDEQQELLLRKKRSLEALDVKLERLKKEKITPITLSSEEQDRYAFVEAVLLLDSFPASRQARRFLKMIQTMQESHVEINDLGDVASYLDIHAPDLRKIWESRDYERKNRALFHRYKLQRSAAKNYLLEATVQNSKIVKILDAELKQRRK